MAVKQVSSITGVSVRNLQFCDEIDLFKPVKKQPTQGICMQYWQVWKI